MTTWLNSFRHESNSAHGNDLEDQPDNIPSSSLRTPSRQSGTRNSILDEPTIISVQDDSDSGNDLVRCNSVDMDDDRSNNAAPSSSQRPTSSTGRNFIFDESTRNANNGFRNPNSYPNNENESDSGNENEHYNSREEQSNSPPPSMRSTMHPLRRQTRLMDIRYALMKIKLRYLQERRRAKPEDDDADLHFFKSLLPYVRTFPTYQKMDYRILLMRITQQYMNRSRIPPPFPRNWYEYSQQQTTELASARNLFPHFAPPNFFEPHQRNED